MARKYEQYIHPYTDGRRPVGGPVIASINGTFLPNIKSVMIPGSNFYLFHWVLPSSSPQMQNIPQFHPPHIHKDAELLFHIGTNPDDPGDLGAEVEIYMGEEMERYVFNRSTVVFIPAGVVHSPWRILKTVRPWIVLQIAQGSEHTEKFFPELVPEEMRDKVDWSLWPDHGFN